MDLHLVAGLDRPLFVYGKRELVADPDLYDRFRSWFPSAQFVNHLPGEGSHKQFAHVLLARALSSARVGLALSQVEGVMRSTMECLVSGLPVVSVVSTGGRDAFLDPSNSVFVEPTAEAVQAGVAERVARRLTVQEVRCGTLALIDVARRTVVKAANRVTHDHLGPAALTIGL